jgi:hypothetical protein
MSNRNNIVLKDEDIETCLYSGETLPDGIDKAPRLDQIRIRFIRELQRHGRPHPAARACGYENAGSFLRWKKLLPKFSEAWDVAERFYITVLEEEAHRRAVEGIDEDVYFKGEVVGQKRVYSDGLLQTLLKANDRGKYGGGDEGSNRGSSGIVILPMVMTSMENWEKQSQLMHQNQKHIAIEGEAIVINEHEKAEVKR